VVLASADGQQTGYLLHLSKQMSPPKTDSWMTDPAVPAAVERANGTNI